MSNATPSSHRLRLMPSKENLDELIIFGIQFCDAVTKSPASQQDSINQFHKGTSALQRAVYAFSECHGPRAAVTNYSGWSNHVIQLFIAVQGQLDRIADALDWSILLEGCAPPMSLNPSLPIAVGGVAKDIGRLQEALDILRDTADREFALLMLAKRPRINAASKPSESKGVSRERSNEKPSPVSKNAHRIRTDEITKSYPDLTEREREALRGRLRYWADKNPDKVNAVRPGGSKQKSVNEYPAEIVRVCVEEIRLKRGE